MKLAQETKDRIFKQIDFYFGDSNLPFDKFLKTECQAEGGWVDLSVVIAFARMQSILGQEWKNPDAVTDDAIESVGAVMRESKVVEISEDGYQIRRRDMPTDWTEVIAAVAARTVHVALLPYDTTLEKLAKYFSMHGKVNQVRLLKHSDKDGPGIFRGSALVEMSSGEEVTGLLSMDLPYEGVSLRIQPKSTYDELLGEARKQKKDTHAVDVHRPLLTVEGLPPDPEPVKKEDQKEVRKVEPAADPNSLANAPADSPANTSAEETPCVVTDDEKGLLIRFEFLGEAAELGSGKALRDAFGGQTKGIRFVEHSTGSTTGVIRLRTQEHALGLLREGGDAGELEVDGGQKFKLTLMTGDEEAAEWKRIRADTAKREAGQRGKRSFPGGRGGAGRHAKRGRR